MQTAEKQPRFAPPKAEPSDKAPLFGWYADVTGRHQLRYWDGKGWTKLVNDNGVKSDDPLDSAATDHPSTNA